MFGKKDNRSPFDEIVTCCANCENASPLYGGEQVLCRKKGVVSEQFLCSKYQFDPLKYIPAERPTLPLSENEER